MNEVRCPYCNAIIEFVDEFTNFEDGGDCIIATATYVCDKCDEAMKVRAYFTWDGNLEVD